MAERQSAHREALEAKVVAGNIASQERGSISPSLFALSRSLEDLR
jgi:hypothetical protein